MSITTYGWYIQKLQINNLFYPYNTYIRAKHLIWIGNIRFLFSARKLVFARKFDLPQLNFNLAQYYNIEKY